ncbi:succinyl-diaminopimelate desuccinylase [bacterium]|jgi:succinyl-diaminopimelate desuccinylase|nr:succinyl-diaminopimelate desuccinylase [bacterium]MBT3582131.1 succinyl-diaminopimelate desuccinylase [bacterium]MBT4552864.1 succinyl-diaminopimelate desuccinylase [bacterium]MBT5988306.1 succinyl-diaminopimelate desuccinylase [bacterium]MBT7087457.1 succinyl-diaminopimelate desuccinylase [bacterium]
MLDLSQNIENILIQLMRIKSVTGEEKELYGQIKTALEKLGYPITFSWQNNLIVKIDLGKKETIGLIGHLDTVPLDNDMQLEPLIKDGEIWGRGACDMKQGLACMLKLAYDFKQQKIEPKYNIMLVFYEGEEGPIKNNGIYNILQKNDILSQIDFAYVLEPTESKYDIGCMGALKAEIILKGKACHSASPWEGENAIYKAKDILIKTENIKDNIVNIEDISAVESINIVQINTTNADNVIPGECVLTLGYRFAPDKTIDEARKILTNTMKTHIEILDAIPASCAPKEACDKYLMPTIHKGILQGWTDIANLNNAGIPAINFGPGSIKQAHKIDERISIKKLNVFYDLLNDHLI